VYIIYFVGIVGDLNPLVLPYILFVAKLFILLAKYAVPTLLLPGCRGKAALCCKPVPGHKKPGKKPRARKSAAALYPEGAHILGFLTRNLNTIKICDVGKLLTVGVSFI
jgi:hypothetical protein